MENLLCCVIGMVNCSLYNNAVLIFSRYSRFFLGSPALFEIMWGFPEKAVTSVSYGDSVTVK